MRRGIGFSGVIALARFSTGPISGEGAWAAATAAMSVSAAAPRNRFDVIPPPGGTTPKRPDCSLPGQRIRPQLEVHHLALRALAAFDVPHEVRAVVGPQPASL